MKNWTLLIAACLFSICVSSQTLISAKIGSPKSLRKGDQIEIPIKIFNNRKEEFKGQIQFLISNDKGTSIDGWIQNVFPVQHYQLNGGDSAEFYFPLAVPFEIGTEKIKFSVVGEDTLKTTEVKIEDHESVSTVKKLYEGNVKIFLVTKGNTSPLQPQTDVFVGDTLFVHYTLHNYLPSNKFETSFQIPANTRLTRQKPSYKTNGTLTELKEYILVTHAGKCSVDGLRITADNRKYFLPIDFTIRSSRK